MGKDWDASGIAYDVRMWAACLEAISPGGYLLSFGGSRTYHRMAVAIEDAGFEIRDQIMWLYGSGFPKSLDVSKAIDKAEDHSRASSYEPNHANKVLGAGFGGGQHGAVSEPPVTSDAATWEGWGTALKPAHEPICVARKPFSGTVAANVLKHGTGALNIDASRIVTEDLLGGGAQSKSIMVKPEGWNRPWMQDEAAKAAHAERCDANVAKAEMLGRWPANVIHDGSDEVVCAFPDAMIQPADFGDVPLLAKRNSNEASHNDANEGAVGFKHEAGRQAVRRRKSGTVLLLREGWR
jgi:hypothetical protein